MSIGYKQEHTIGPTVGRIVLGRDGMRPLSRQKRMKQALGSDHPIRVSKSRLLLEGVDHLNDTMFRCRLRKIQFPVWVTEFPQRRCCLRVTSA